MVFSGDNIAGAVPWKYEDLEQLQEHNKNLVDRMIPQELEDKLFNE